MLSEESLSECESGLGAEGAFLSCALVEVLWLKLEIGLGVGVASLPLSLMIVHRAAELPCGVMILWSSFGPIAVSAQLCLMHSAVQGTRAGRPCLVVRRW